MPTNHEHNSDGDGRYEGPDESDIERSYSDEYDYPGSSRWRTIIWQAFATVVGAVFILSLVLGVLGPPRQRDEPPTQPMNTGTVTNVLNGNTITVQREHEEFLVRYIGVSTPAPGAPLHDLATEVNRDWVDGETVLLEGDRTDLDSQGALLRYVYLDDAMINANLIYQGLAEVDTSGANSRYTAEFERLEAEAKAAGRGIWATDDGELPRVSTRGKQKSLRNRRS